MRSRPVTWITHPSSLLHDMGPGHPESPQRLQAIENRLWAAGMMDILRREEAPPATVEQLARVHAPAMIESLMKADLGAGPRAIDDDTVQAEHTLPAALHAAGAVVRGVERVLSDQASLAFCAVRPPGHHAERDRAMGFCFFNNVAVGAAHALALGLKRVAILDFDVHYGNGTAHIFRDDPRVWMYSTYQHLLYPRWPGAPLSPHLVDAPLRAFSGSEAFRAAVTQHWLPALTIQQPQLILVSAGFDAHAQDPLSDLRLGYEDYHWIGEVIRNLASDHCEGRVVATLEGGYDLHALPRSVECFLQPFVGL
ncbi:MAG: histone deacetylase family protein [Panacagrimonas sp.]